MVVRALALGCALLVPAPAAAALSIVKTGPANPVEAGTGFQYTIKVTNLGTTTVSFHLHDALPEDVVFGWLFINGDYPGPEVCTLPDYGWNDVPIECDYSSLAPGNSVEFTLNALLRFCLPAGEDVTNTATATAPGDSPVSSQCSFSTLEQTVPYCTDFNACTEYDQCYDGYCQGPPRNGCPDNDPCTIDGCNPHTGCTFEPVVCPDDNNPCTSAACDIHTGCTQANVASGTSCPASGPCVTGGVCDGAGSCVPVTVCDDGNACTDDFADGSCACTHGFVPPGFPCDDGNACTVQDSCNGAGSCTAAPYPAPADVGASMRVNRSGGINDPFVIAITWGFVANAETYEAIRGSIGALPVGPGGGDEFCVGSGFAFGSIADTQLPAPGSAYWYLLRGVNACAGPGPWGFQGSHGASGAPRVTTTSCP